jgi:hypothetical protein
MPDKLNIAPLINQDNGLLATIHANSIAMSKVALNDNTISEESKLIIEQLANQIQLYYNKIISNKEKTISDIGSDIKTA